MKRVALIGYAVIAYVGFLTVIAWVIVWLTDLSPVTGIDHGVPSPAFVAAGIDLLLLGVFAVHHSVLARPAAKRMLARLLPVRAERSTYVLGADLLLALVLWLWYPIPGLVWRVDAQPWRGLIWAAYVLGWLLAITATFMIDHLDFVGLRQAASRRYRPPRFEVRWLYSAVRHPLMLGLLIAFWATPTMSWGHVLFAVAASAYIAVGIRFEERDLRATLGEPYRAYAARTPAVLPLIRMPHRRAAR